MTSGSPITASKSERAGGAVGWLTALDDTRRAALLAHCVSFGVNALYEKGDRYGGPGVSVHGVQQRLAQSDRLARVVGLDMVAAGWRPTVDNYLGRVTKPHILEAVREAKGDQAAELLDHLKKGEMAREAERLLDGAGWLPEPLRLADSALSSDPPAERGRDPAGISHRRRGSSISASRRIGRSGEPLPRTCFPRASPEARPACRAFVLKGAKHLVPADGVEVRGRGRPGRV